MKEIRNVLVLGAGSAGLIAALSLKLKLPELQVSILRSSELGIIGVGEGTTPNFPSHLFEFLGLNRKHFWSMAKPTWKLGIRFLWGARGRFDYTFDKQLDMQLAGLSQPNAFYCDEEFAGASLPAALMRQDKVFLKQANGCPDVQGWHALHIENEHLVSYLEAVAAEIGITTIEGLVDGAERAASGEVAAVRLSDGRRLEADFFVDASGFRSELLGKFLEEPFDDYRSSLFCDRAWAAGWDRTDEPILPYTTAETMNAGWAWQIEHEHHINRGYVFGSAAISDDEAAAEFLRKNPRIKREPRLIKFRSGSYRRQWVENVVAIGNAGGFVEPLEATALMVVCGNCQLLVEMLGRSQNKPTEGMRTLFNEMCSKSWLDIRDFLALHYKLNGMLDTPFWQHCRNDTPLDKIAPLLEFYRENGPTGFCRFRMGETRNDFGLEGYLVMLVGNKAPYRHMHISAAERQLWQNYRQQLISQANGGMDIKEALKFVHNPGWHWHGDA